ncbi:MAG: insulinase family protein, partial [Clostridia bacterium]|nr:insulinase family protein [Clostridia bacterium]
ISEIKTQVDLLKQGKFTEEEFDATIKNITSSIKVLGDSIGYLCDYYLGNAVTNTILSPDEFVEKIKNVTREDVINVAQKLELEMIYFLTGKESEEK